MVPLVISALSQLAGRETVSDPALHFAFTVDIQDCLFDPENTSVREPWVMKITVSAVIIRTLAATISARVWDIPFAAFMEPSCRRRYKKGVGGVRDLSPDAQNSNMPEVLEEGERTTEELEEDFKRSLELFKKTLNQIGSE